VVATRFVTPLREGSSVPALVEADDDGLYVVKLLGAGHGRKALVVELLAGEIGRLLGLPVPDLVHVVLDAALARAEPDGEIRDLLARRQASTWGSTSCPARSPSRPRLVRRPNPTWPRPSSGSTPWSPTWTARRATPTSSCGTAGLSAETRGRGNRRAGFPADTRPCTDRHRLGQVAVTVGREFLPTTPTGDLLTGVWGWWRGRGPGSRVTTGNEPDDQSYLYWMTEPRPGGGR
jgi:hypothetical protein